MVDYAALEAACRKKINAKARNDIVEEIEACRACHGNTRLANALEFLLQREDEIDAALRAPDCE